MTRPQHIRRHHTDIAGVTGELQHGSVQDSMLALHRSLDFESFWCASQGLLAAALPYHSCSVFRIGGSDLQDVRHHVAAPESPGYSPASSLSVSRDFLCAHPRIDLYTYSEILTQDPDASRRRLAQEPVVGNWSEFVHLAFWEEVRPTVVLSVRRSTDQQAFTSEEIRFLSELHPVMAASLNRIEAIYAQRARLEEYQQWLARSQSAIMLLNGQGELMVASPRALGLAQRWNSSSQRNDRSVRSLRLPGDVPRLMSDPTHFGVTEWNGTSPLFLKHARNRHLSVQIDRSSARSSPSVTYRITFICLPASDSSARTGQASDILDQLSPAEGRVAQLIAQGLSNLEIADRLNRSRRTVEFQLSSIYRKLNIARREQLVRALICRPQE